MRLGTATADMPAALAAAAPWAESSRATLAQRVGAEVGAGPEVHVGRRLADAAHEVGAHERAERWSEPEAVEVALEPGPADEDEATPIGTRPRSALSTSTSTPGSSGSESRSERSCAA